MLYRPEYYSQFSQLTRHLIQLAGTLGRQNGNYRMKQVCQDLYRHPPEDKEVERLWRAYRQGDEAALTRYLWARSNTLPSRRACKRAKREGRPVSRPTFPGKTILALR